jgi:hypothetical protein
MFSINTARNAFLVRVHRVRVFSILDGIPQKWERFSYSWEAMREMVWTSQDRIIALIGLDSFCALYQSLVFEVSLTTEGCNSLSYERDPFWKTSERGADLPDLRTTPGLEKA